MATHDEAVQALLDYLIDACKERQDAITIRNLAGAYEGMMNTGHHFIPKRQL